ncbi:PREDICTED: consortin [Condylura cristata]|uniref:consortin n=1 Tax=Condylura cristata TaxID=143302 RepID=UPI0003346A63|nr:PREDICTED: consortin [Condylura cristata]
MDDSGTPTCNLQIEAQDGSHSGERAETIGVHLPSAADENENQLGGDRCEHLSSSDSAMGKPEVSEQDCLNNNESCAPSCEETASETPDSTPCGDSRDGQALLGKDKKIPGKRSPRSKRSTAKKIPQGLSSGDPTPFMQENILSAASHVVSEESAEINANDQPEARKQVLQSLFSLTRGEVKQLDSRTLPLCLHQIAESYFQEEDYEKAMKFIQLERLYHEQLLANLSAIQEQWETKWKTVQPHTVTSLRNSEKGFNGEDFEQLTKFCTTHQDPLLSKYKIAAVEKSLGRKCLMQLEITEDPKENGATAKEPESAACLGIDSSGENQCQEETRERGPCCHQALQAGLQALAVTSKKDHTEELCSPEAPPEGPAQPSEQAACSRPRSHSAEDAGEDDSHLLLPQAETCQNVARIEGIAEEPEVSLSSKSVVEPDPPPVLVSDSKCVQPHRQEFQLPRPAASRALLPDQLENRALNKLQPSDLTGSDGKSPPPGWADPEHCEAELCDNGEVSGLSAALREACMAPEETRDKDDPINKETEDYLNSLLEGCLKGAEDCLSSEENQDEDSDLQDLSPEEASYSLQENLPADDPSCLSLDDLAKRIEIAEVVPAEGLVSILKKRNATVGDSSAQMQQKSSKRRVRFQEIDDTLDQDEVGGGSCVLLLLLCVATVLLSVGGTALYCAVGDVQSPVCTDFAENTAFYYTQLLQGLAELKHWVYLS